MRCLGARTCPSPRPKPLPIRLLTKSMGNARSVALGRRASPLPGCWRTMSPWAPVSVSAFKPPLFSGDLGGPACCSPSCLLCAAMFLCCQIGPHSPSSALGTGARFLLPHALDPHPTPKSGNSGHQVPCIESLCWSAFPRSRLTWEESVSPLPLPLPGMMVPHQFLLGRERKEVSCHL